MNCDKKWIVIFILLCLSACSIKLLPSKDKWYAKHYIIMQGFEWKIYKELSSEGREQFQELFWKVRYLKARVIFTNRLDYVMKNFKKESSYQPWNTDRGRIYLLNGNPAEIRYIENTDLGGYDFSSFTDPKGGRNVDRSKEDIGGLMSEFWVYPYKSYIITYQFDFVQPKKLKLIPKLSESLYLGELERHSRVVTYGIIDVEKYQEQLEELKKIK